MKHSSTATKPIFYLLISKSRVCVCLCTCMCVYVRSRPFAPKAVNPMNMSPPYQITILHSAYLDMSNYLSTKYSNQNAYQIKLKNLIGSAQE